MSAAKVGPFGDLSALENELRLAFSKLGKKDATTKLKGLQEIDAIFTARPDDSVVEALPFWVDAYNRLYLDDEWRVRTQLNQTFRTVCRKVKRELAPHIKKVLGPWLCNQDDPSRDVAEAARAAFAAAFPPEKIPGVYAFAASDLIVFMADLFEQKPETLSDLNVVPKDVADARYDRAMSSAVQALGTVLAALPPAEFEKHRAELDAIFTKKFWKFLTASSADVRKGMYELVKKLCTNQKDFLAEHLASVAPLVLGAFQDHDSRVHGAMWDAVLVLASAFPDVWGTVNARKAILPRLWQFLRNGCHGSGAVSYRCLMPFIGCLPKDILEDGSGFFNAFFEALWQGRAAVAGSPDADALVAALCECISYAMTLARQLNERAEGVARVHTFLLHGPLLALLREFLAVKNVLYTHGVVMRGVGGVMAAMAKDDAQSEVIVSFFAALERLVRRLLALPAEGGDVADLYPDWGKRQPREKREPTKGGKKGGKKGEAVAEDGAGPAEAAEAEPPPTPVADPRADEPASEETTCERLGRLLQACHRPPAARDLPALPALERSLWSSLAPAVFASGDLVITKVALLGLSVEVARAAGLATLVEGGSGMFYRDTVLPRIRACLAADSAAPAVADRDEEASDEEDAGPKEGANVVLMSLLDLARCHLTSKLQEGELSAEYESLLAAVADADREWRSMSLLLEKIPPPPQSAAHLEAIIQRGVEAVLSAKAGDREADNVISVLQRTGGDLGDGAPALLSVGAQAAILQAASAALQKALDVLLGSAPKVDKISVARAHAALRVVAVALAHYGSLEEGARLAALEQVFWVLFPPEGMARTAAVAASAQAVWAKGLPLFVAAEGRSARLDSLTRRTASLLAQGNAWITPLGGSRLVCALLLACRSAAERTAVVDAALDWSKHLPAAPWAPLSQGLHGLTGQTLFLIPPKNDGASLVAPARQLLLLALRLIASLGAESAFLGATPNMALVAGATSTEGGSALSLAGDEADDGASGMPRTSLLVELLHMVAFVSDATPLSDQSYHDTVGEFNEALKQWLPADRDSEAKQAVLRDVVAQCIRRAHIHGGLYAAALASLLDKLAVEMFMEALLREIEASDPAACAADDTVAHSARVVLPATAPYLDASTWTVAHVTPFASYMQTRLGRDMARLSFEGVTSGGRLMHVLSASMSAVECDDLGKLGNSVLDFLTAIVGDVISKLPDTEAELPFRCAAAQLSLSVVGATRTPPSAKQGAFLRDVAANCLRLSQFEKGLNALPGGRLTLLYLGLKLCARLLTVLNRGETPADQDIATEFAGRVLAPCNALLYQSATEPGPEILHASLYGVLRRVLESCHAAVSDASVNMKQLIALLAAPIPDVQKAAYAVLSALVLRRNREAEAARERVDRETEDKTASAIAAAAHDAAAAPKFALPSSLRKLLLSENLWGGSLHDIFCLLLGWSILVDHAVEAPEDQAAALVEYLQDRSAVPAAPFLTALFEFVADARGTGALGRPVHVSEVDATSPASVAAFATNLFMRFLIHMPKVVRNWWMASGRDLSKRVQRYIEVHISPTLISEAITTVGSNKELSVECLRVQSSVAARQVTAVYEKDDIKLELVVVLPDCYPLQPVKVESGAHTGIGDEQWRRWVLTMTTMLSTQVASLSDVLLYWKRNVENKFAGISECPICYAVLHLQNHTLPRMVCKTCKNKFHSACLYKWFTSSQGSTCPLCRTPF